MSAGGGSSSSSSLLGSIVGFAVSTEFVSTTGWFSSSLLEGLSSSTTGGL